MALTFGGKLNLSGNVTLSTYTSVLAGPVIEYVMGNSASFNGQGIDLSHNDFTNAPSGNINLIMDISADYANGLVGNYGYFYGQDNANISGGDFVNNGPLSYLKFAGDGTGNGHDVSSNQANGPDIPGNSSYTIFSVVRVNNFGDPSNPSTWTGGIVGGDQTIFGFIPPGFGPPTNYPWLYASNNGFSGDSIVDYYTQFQPDTWYAVAVTYDANSQIMKTYVNGVNTATSTGIAPFTNAEPLYWGTWEGNNWLNGDLAVMTVWTRALSPTEISNYTNTYGGPYGVANAVQNNSMPAQTYSQLFNVPGTYSFTVPAGVTSISTVAVGAGGGGTWDAYSPPGGDSYIYSQWVNYNVDMTTNAGYNGAPFITLDCTSGNNASLLGNVAPGWLVTSTDLNNYYPNRALIQGNVYGMVTAVDSTDPANVVLTISPILDSTSGGIYNFLGQTIVGAQGAYEIDENHYNTNSNGTPGPRALPLWGDSGGKGGVVDSLSSWPIGGAGAGGYGTNDLVVAFDPTQTYVYNGAGDYDIGDAHIILALSNNNLSVEATANNTSYPGIATGTYDIVFGQKVMFSLTVATSASAGSQGIGFGGYGANIASYVGGDTNSGGFYNDGGFYTNGSAFSGYPTFTTGDIVDIAIDNSNVSGQTTWVRVNGGDWMGDPVANPATGTNGLAVSINNDGTIYLMTTQGSAGDVGKWSINTSNAYSTPSGYSFIAGSDYVGSNGGTGTNQELPTNTDGLGNGNIGGSGGGGGGIYNDIGSGGGGVGLYGVGNPGNRGGWVDSNTYTGNNPYSQWQAQAIGGRGGSRRGSSGTNGGIASSWAGGAGGWPGGGGGSGTSLWDGGNGGALSYKNNVTVTPGNNYHVIVGQGGWGGGIGNVSYYSAGVGGAGAVRIVWPGNTRQFPDTNVGIDPTGPSSFTITTNDFAGASNNNNMSANSSGGYVVSLTATAGSNIIDSYVSLYGLVNNTLAQDITAVYVQAGMTTFGTLQYSGATPNPYQFNSYIFNVTWADSSTGKVRMSWNSQYGQLILSVIDTGYTDWQTASPINSGNPNPVLGGTFSFPATFTPYTPLIQSNGEAWC